ncbi:HD domain-containing protein [Hoeflea sp.]|uniref:HD domain-containing protein n=1 Tax=Hoeflea sp. TaxID=1940281 RepID=UPI0019A8A583|nr:HD domain-containing protein [Hoeflea sp.]MBC7283169.1 HD domain-containing protein [Hoeflea sp.]
MHQIHRGQTRRGGEPYFNHLIEVEELCRQLLEQNEFGLQGENNRFDILATALLHDSIEDTATDYEDVLRVANRQVADWVGLLSEDKRKPKKIRRLEYLDVLGSTCFVVQTIKLADVYSNLSGVNFSEERDWILEYLERSKQVLEKLQLVRHLNLFTQSQETISKIKSQLSL